jgi:hypothetical protein
MTELVDAAVLLLILLGSSAAGLFVRPLLSEHHRSRETFELVQLVTTMLVTFAALVLGLLTSSAKSSFDTVGSDLRGLGSDLIQLDQSLREYGPATETARQLLRSCTAADIASTWPKEPLPDGDYYPRQLPKADTGMPMESVALGAMLSRVELELRQLEPLDAMQRRLASDCLNEFEHLKQRRWKLIEEAHSSISMPFYVVLIFWLAVVFTSLGLSAPQNLLVFVLLTLGAVSIASAIFVILDLDAPFIGLFGVSSQPLRAALIHLNQ